MEALYVGYAAGAVYFALPFLYWWTAPDWWKTSAGQALMMLMASSALAFVMILATGIFGAYPYREVVRYVIYGAVLIAGIRLSALFLQLRFGSHQETWTKADAP